MTTRYATKLTVLDNHKPQLIHLNSPFDEESKTLFFHNGSQLLIWWHPSKNIKILAPYQGAVRFKLAGNPYLLRFSKKAALIFNNAVIISAFERRGVYSTDHDMMNL